MKSFTELREKTLTPAEKKKREEIAQAMEREDPGMDMSKKMAIATAQAKKVAEEVNEISKAKLTKYIAKATDDHEHQNMGRRNTTGATSDAYARKEKLRKKGISRAFDRMDNMRKEDVTEDQQIDELSRKTLGSYMSKASDASKHRGMPTKKVDQRYSGVAKASKKLDKMNNEEVDEGAQQTLRKYVPGYAKKQIDKKMDDAKFGKTDVDKDANFYRYKKVQDKLKKEELHIEKTMTKTFEQFKEATDSQIQKVLGPTKNAQQGIAALKKAFKVDDKKAKEMLVKAMESMEEDSQLDELSPKTLSSYAAKASDARGHKGMPTKKVDKRYSGVAKASQKLDKMNNEEAQDVSELKTDTLRSYIKKSNTAMAGRSKKAQASIPKRMTGKIRALDRLAGGQHAKLQPGETGRPMATHQSKPYKAK